MKPIANVQRVRGLGYEPRSESMKERKHLFTNSVDVHYFGQIDNQAHLAASCDERSNVFRSLAGQPAFEFEGQSIN
jgi:hypothetical protein